VFIIICTDESDRESEQCSRIREADRDKATGDLRTWRTFVWLLSNWAESEEYCAGLTGATATIPEMDEGRQKSTRSSKRTGERERARLTGDHVPNTIRK
jgi:hypothetical protein